MRFSSFCLGTMVLLAVAGCSGLLVEREYSWVRIDTAPREHFLARFRISQGRVAMKVKVRHADRTESDLLYEFGTSPTHPCKYFDKNNWSCSWLTDQLSSTMVRVDMTDGRVQWVYFGEVREMSSRLVFMGASAW